ICPAPNPHGSRRAPKGSADASLRPVRNCRPRIFLRRRQLCWGSRKNVMHGQMYVEVLTPRNPRHPFPLVLIHGAAQTATNWMGTPDGRPGWADFFVGQGYTVYMIDQPARGRSAWQPGIDGKLTTFPA